MNQILTDTVVSVSGTYNETLTMTTGGMTVNLYKDMYFEHEGTRYIIASNTATTITLITPSSAYTSLAGESITIIQHYATYNEVKSAIMRAANRTDGSQFTDSLATADELIDAIQSVEEAMNNEMDLEDESVNPTRFLKILRRICCNVIAMDIMRGSRFRKVNPGEDAATYWQITPTFTRDDLRQLRKIGQKIRYDDENTSYVFNIDTGEQL